MRLLLTLAAPIVVIETVRFLDESEVHEDVDVPDHGSPRDPPGIGDGLVAGEALVGLAIALGEDYRKRPPGRGSDQGEVALG